MEEGGASMRFRAGGVTTFGEQVVEHEVTIRKEAQEVERMSQLIFKYLTDGPEHDCFQSKRFVVAHFNYYCADTTTNPKYLLPAEFSLRTFSLDEGLLRWPIANGLIDPQIVPSGMRCEAMETAEQIKVPMIGKGEGIVAHLSSTIPPCDPLLPPTPVLYTPRLALEAFDNIIQKAAPQISDQKWIFVTRDQISVADRCLKYLKLQDSLGVTDDHGYRLAPLSMLALEIKNLCTHHIGTNIPNITNEGHAERILEHPQYAYNAEIACRWHAMYEHEDAVDKCSNNIVSRMIYNMLGYIRVTQSFPVYAPQYAPTQQKIDVVDREAMEKMKQSMEQNAREERSQHQKWQREKGQQGRGGGNRGQQGNPK